MGFKAKMRGKNVPPLCSEGDKGVGRDQRINIRRSIKQGAGFLFCLVSELAELGVISCSGPA